MSLENKPTLIRDDPHRLVWRPLGYSLEEDGSPTPADVFRSDIWEKWVKWRDKNQHAIDWILDKIDGWQLKEGRQHYGTHGIEDQVRLHCPKVNQTDPDFRINSNITTYFVRYLIYKKPGLESFFDFRPTGVRVRTCIHCPTCSCEPELEQRSLRAVKQVGKYHCKSCECAA
jgi:hypothetical protein